MARQRSLDQLVSFFAHSKSAALQNNFTGVYSNLESPCRPEELQKPFPNFVTVSYVEDYRCKTEVCHLQLFGWICM